MKPFYNGVSAVIVVVCLYICLSPLYVISGAVADITFQGGQFSPFVYITSLVVVGMGYAIGVAFIISYIKRRFCS